MERTKKRQNRVWVLIISIILLTFVSVAVSQFVKLKTGAEYYHYYNSLKAGDIAEQNILASSSFDVVDFEKTEELRADAISKVIPRFSISMDSCYAAIQKFENLKNEGTYSQKVYDYAYEVLYKLIQQGFFDFKESSEIISKGFSEVLITNSGKTVSLTSAITQSNISLWVYQQLGKYRNELSEDGMRQVQDMVLVCAQENMFFNEVETQKALIDAEKSVENVVISIEKGQRLISEDHVITEEQLELLLLIANQERLSVKKIIEQAAFCLVCFSLTFIVYGLLMKKENAHFLQYTIALSMSVAVSLAASFFTIDFFSNLGGNFHAICLPVMFAPVLITMMTGNKMVGFTASFLFATGICIIPGSGIQTFFFCLVSGCACVYFVRFVNKRSDSVIQWAISVVTVAVVYILIGGSSFTVFSGIRAWISILGVITLASIILVNIILPICERLMNLPTVYRLYELASGDSKILKKLSAEAPGTFNHSTQVSELAQTAAMLVGADALLAKVGGLYHDIGKIDHPEYFVENQSKENKHEDLNPSLSASIIKSHVKVGAEKGKDAGLPKEVIDIIYQHHGNDVISFFYHEAVRDNDEDDGEVEKYDYSYNADIPASRECGIVMLADSVEAAARTIQNPTAAQFEKLINQIINTKIEHGQLNNCSLTMKDLDIISQSFLKSLSAMYHSRIEYPDEEED